MLSAAGVNAQQPYNLTAPVKSLATLFTDIYGPNGLIVDSLATLPGEVSHSAHFTSDFQTNFGQFSAALVGQLVTVPLPSPASGFTYRFDPTVGVFQRTSQSFGPILAERSETIGAGRLSFGFAYQRFNFDTVEGLSLHRVPAVFTHDNAQLRGGRDDVITTLNSIDARVSQFTLFLSRGVTDRFDVAIAVPLVTQDLKVVSDATIHRLGTTNPLTHFFRLSDGDVGDRRLFTASGHAAGIGDLTIRFKGTLFQRSSGGLAAGMDVGLPTGDEMNLLGTGAASLAPFAAWSATYQKISPHLNAGYRWNGSSVLAGNPATGASANFPDSVAYAAGVDVSVNPKVTIGFDVLGHYVLDSERLSPRDFHAQDGQSVFPSIGFATDSFNTMGGSIGMKANILERLLLDMNLLFALDHAGVRDKVTPLIGLEYAF
jgi:hypothetical protein